MFGIFRLGLALLVVVYHLSERHIIGWYSVYAFYALSGFLMTLVISKKYGLSHTGIVNFTINRVLRIYPPYLVVCLTSLLILQVPAFAHKARELLDLGMPLGAKGWLENIFIWGWHMKIPKLVPQVWTVFRELFYCVLIFFPFARYRWLALAWFVGSAAYAVSTVVRGVVFLDVYTTFKAASLAYSAGCCIFHFQKNLRPLTRPLAPLIALAAIAPFSFEAVRPHLFAHESVVPLYINSALSAYLVLLLSCLQGSPRLLRLDRSLGNLSYPIYLCHANVAIVVATLLNLPGLESDRLLLVSFIPIVACAWVLNRFVEQTVGYGYDQRRKPWRSRSDLPAAPVSAPGLQLAPPTSSTPPPFGITN